jgi:putative transposase
MCAAGIQGVHRRRFVRTTHRDQTAAPAADLVNRRFEAAALDVLWVADITYVWTWAGFLYLAMVLDACSRRVVGWAMADHLRTELVLAALDMAVHTRRPGSGLVHHSDRGCQTGFNPSSQHRLVDRSIGGCPWPRREPASQASCEVAR